MLRRLLLIHPLRLDGENRGVYEQHVSSMRALLADAPGWQVYALDPAHPSFPQAALAAELVIVHMLTAPEIEAVIRLRRARGLATIFEISDNFLAPGGWLPQRHAMRNPLVRQRIAFHASIADAVQVYAPGLTELCRHLHPRIVQLDPYVPLQGPRARDEGFVIGWGGTTSHEEDLARIAPVIADLCRNHDDVTFAFIGNRDMGRRLFGAIPPQKLRMRDFTDYASYLEFVSSWTVGVAPMRRSGFNAGRSDTKFATYAACGIAAVLEDCDVYSPHADHALLFRGTDDLRTILESLYEDRAAAADVAARARAWAERERGPERLRAQRLAAYEPFTPRETGEPWMLEEDVPSLTGDLDILRAVVREHPGFAQARLALADALRSAGDARGALEVLDQFTFPPVLAGVAAERGYALAQQVCPERSEEYASGIDSPTARLRVSHRAADHRVFLRALLDEQPFDYIALATLLPDLLARKRDSEEVRNLCARACLVAPELVPRELRPTTLTRFLDA